MISRKNMKNQLLHNYFIFILLIYIFLYLKKKYIHFRIYFPLLLLRNI